MGWHLNWGLSDLLYRYLHNQLIGVVSPSLVLLGHRNGDIIGLLAGKFLCQFLHNWSRSVQVHTGFELGMIK
jgi:hypothetical protein